MKLKNLVMVAGVVVLSTVFSGCASNGMAVNTVDNNKVDRYFINGKIVNQQKCVINDREMAVLTGAGVGGLGGAVVGGHNRGGGAVVGAVVGGLLGAMVGKEVVAYKTTINADNGKEYTCYLKQKVSYGSTVEFTVVNGKLKNVNVTKINTDKYSL